MTKIGFLFSYLKIYLKDIEFVTYTKLTETLKNVDVKNIEGSKYIKQIENINKYINENSSAYFNGFTSCMVLYDSLQTWEW